ncbi:MAG: nucleoside triphosphate pyrophosphohydrolase [Luteitalea sp.]|nr:nucleoside triphosphate pyrophosphohydrolase [Luteitalea sp.]
MSEPTRETRPADHQRAGAALQRLAGIMARLRSPTGCPWDREQTLKTLAPYVIEEAYEVVEAIERNDMGELRGEIGDLVFEGVFLAQLCAESRFFTLADALEDVGDKLIRRHPHVFARETDDTAVRITTPDDVKVRWEEIKARERDRKGQTRRSVIDGVPRALPALLRAYRLSARAATVGFDWPDPAAVVAKVREEMSEVEEAAARGDEPQTTEELGDLLFAVVNLARKLGVEPEAALRAANDKFTQRFEAMQQALAEGGKAMDEVTLDEMDAAWNAAKRLTAP